MEREGERKKQKKLETNRNRIEFKVLCIPFTSLNEVRRQNLRWFVIRSKLLQLFQHRPVAVGHRELYYRTIFPNSLARATLISSEEMMRSLQQVVAWQLYTTLDSHHIYTRLKWMNPSIKFIVIQLSGKKVQEKQKQKEFEVKLEHRTKPQFFM